ncbi:hypothetical protein F2981_16635 [Sinorhizobium meliloti]|nr:hypothetical protein [Sinorhizobium meliloti]
MTEIPVGTTVVFGTGTKITVTIRFLRDRKPVQESDCLSTIRFHDESGVELPQPYEGAATSRAVGPYKYLASNPDGICRFELKVPQRAASLTLGVRKWNAKSEVAVEADVNFEVISIQNPEVFLRKTLFHLNKLHEQLNAVPKVLSAAGKLKAASILDEISELNWGSDFDLKPIPREDSLTKLRAQDPSFLFLESAWRGNKKEWEYAFTSPGLTHANAQALTSLMDSVREEKTLPIVFWNKEDPLHYEKFLPFAKKADFIFTTDEACVARYVDGYSGTTIRSFLPFAQTLTLQIQMAGSRRLMRLRTFVSP